MTSPSALDHLSLLVALVATVGLGGGLLLLSDFLGPRRPTPVKLEAFECGNPSSGPATARFNVKFYLVAILFLVFDIEAVFIYPWALVYHDRAAAGAPVLPLLVAMGTFVGVVGTALAYVWRKGALEWAQDRRLVAAEAREG